MTVDKIIEALRCTSAPGGPIEDCGKRPFLKTEKLTTEQAKQLGTNNWTSCDIDRVGMEAADRLANDQIYIAALQKEIEKLRGQLPRWIPVEERLPEKQGWYHVAIRDEKTKRIAVELDLYAIETAKNFGHEIGFCKDSRWDGREKVIAWMPLPEPPEVENAEAK